MPRYFLTALAFCLMLSLPIRGQDRIDRGRVYYQLAYQPGDWVTYASSRHIMGVAVGYGLAYIGTDGGVLQIDLNTHDFSNPLTTSDHLLDNTVTCLGIDHTDQLLWIATKSGLHIYNQSSYWVHAYPYSDIGVPLFESVMSIGFQSEFVWLQTSSHFYKSNKIAVRFAQQPLVDPDVEWFGQLERKDAGFPTMFTRANSEYVVVGSKFVDREFTDYPVSCYSADSRGNWFVGTAGAGLWLVQNVSGLAEPLIFGPCVRDIRTMALDGDHLIIGGFSAISDQYSGGLTLWDLSSNRVMYDRSGFSNNLISGQTTVVMADSENYWIGTTNGLYQRRKLAGSWTRFRPGELDAEKVLSLSAGTNGSVLIGTESGIDLAVPVGHSFVIQKVVYDGLRNTAIHRIHSDQSGLWLGTSNGIFHIDQDGLLNHYDAMGFQLGPMNYAGEDVRAIAADDTSIFFVSERGVVCLDKNSHQWKSIPIMSDFLRAGVNDAKVDAYNLWIATNEGVLRLERQKSKWVFYDAKDGLASSMVRCLLLDPDYVLFGTEAGVTKFFWRGQYYGE